MKEEDKHILEKELDKIIERFNDNGFNAQEFINYSRLLQQTFFNNIGLHRKSRECVFPYCPKHSIQRSHSIPKSSFLLNIASNGHLLKPEFDLKSNVPIIKMESIGIMNASVFPGYCEEHENFFKSFEIDGEIDSAKKALLQMYRTICRERVFREIEIDINEKVKSKYIEKINDEALKNIKESLSRFTQLNDVRDVKINGTDSVIYALNCQNKYLSEINKNLLDLENKIYHHIFSKPERNELIIHVINVDIKFPISLCGFATQRYQENDKEKTAYILINILPLKESTYVVGVGLERDRAICKQYFEYSFSDHFTILNMIESFMVNGSDHWFINPDYWANISKQKQEKILYDILTTEDSFLDEYPISIFDDIRKKILSIFIENTKHRKLTLIETQRIDIEMKKVARNDFEIKRDDNKFIERLLNKIMH